MGKLKKYLVRRRNLFLNTGLRGTIAYYFKTKLWWFARLIRWRLSPNQIYKLYWKFIPTPVFARLGTSDRTVFLLVLANLEYDCLHVEKAPRLIVDCGANVGYTSLFFLVKYPNSKVIAVEPDLGNFALLKKNLDVFGSRIKAIRGAVWSHATGLSIRSGQFRDGREWSTQVIETPQNEKPDMQALGMADILATSGFSRIDILKIDIERAEIILFGNGVEKWLNYVDNIVIELHDTECEKIFFQALRGFKYKLSKYEELTIVEGLSAKENS